MVLTITFMWIGNISFFLAAESVGKAYRELIKGRFPSRKLSEEAELVALRERLAKFCR